MSPAVRGCPCQSVPVRAPLSFPPLGTPLATSPAPETEGAMIKPPDVGETLGAAQDLRALLEAGQGYRLIVDAVEDYAIFTMDPEGRVASWNPGAHRLLGYGAEETLGRDGACFFIPEDVQKGAAEAELRRAAETGRASDDRWHMRKNGSYFFARGITP